MSDEWEQYRDRYESERPDTFAAYTEVWQRDASVRRKFSGWAIFARCANAETSTIRETPDLVREAEALMSRNGYRIGSTTESGARTWSRTDGKLRSSYSSPGKPATSTARKRTSRATSNKATRKATTPLTPPKRPRHVECPNDPGMMVPLDGECMCGWRPDDA